MHPVDGTEGMLLSQQHAQNLGEPAKFPQFCGRRSHTGSSPTKETHLDGELSVTHVRQGPALQAAPRNSQQT